GAALRPPPPPAPHLAAPGEGAAQAPLHTPAGPPALDPVGDRALGAELAGELLPLPAAAQAEDDPVERRPPVGVPPPGRLAGPELPEDGKDLLPQGIRDLPDGPQRLGLRLPPGPALDLGHAGTLL